MHLLSADCGWLHNLHWADNHDLFHSTYSKSHGADKLFQSIKDYKTIFFFSVNKKKKETKLPIHSQSTFKMKPEKKGNTSKTIMHNECQQDRSEALRWLWYRFMSSDIQQMVRISEGGDANVRSAEMPWPSACHLREQSSTWRHGKLLPLRCTNPEVAKAAVTKATEKKVLNCSNLIILRDKQPWEEPWQHKCTKKAERDIESCIDFEIEHRRIL